MGQPTAFSTLLPLDEQGAGSIKSGSARWSRPGRRRIRLEIRAQEPEATETGEQFSPGRGSPRATYAKGREEDCGPGSDQEFADQRPANNALVHLFTFDISGKLTPSPILQTVVPSN